MISYFNLNMDHDTSSSRSSSTSPAPNLTPAVLVVDPYTEGATLAARFTAQGYTVVHVLSDPCSNRARSAKWEEWQLVVRHEGDPSGNDPESLDLTIERARAVLAESAYDAPIGAVAAGAEEGVELADQLASALGLKGNDLSLAQARRDKWVMTEAVRAAGLRAAHQAHVHSEEEALAFWRALPSPAAIMKPRSSMKSEDVYLCKSEEELLRAYRMIAGKRNFLNVLNEGALAQEYLDGEEYVVDAVTCDGVHKVNALFHIDRATANGQFNVMYGARLMQPAEAASSAIVPYARDVLTAIGVQNGASHMELKLTSTGPCLIEAAARPCGDPITPLLNACLGRNQMDQIVDALLHPLAFSGDYEELPAVPKRAGRQSFIVSKFEGDVVSVPGLKMIEALPSVRKVYLFRKAGDRLEKTVDQKTQAGFMLMWHEDESVVERDYAEIRRLENSGSIFELSQ